VNPATRSESTLLGLAGRALLVSSPLAAIGVVFLVAMFVSFGIGDISRGQDLGRINDILVLVSYLLAAPSVVAFGSILRPVAPVASGILTVIGIAAIVAIVVLQAMLISGAVTFEQQIGPVSVALLVLAAWFLVTGHMASSSGFLLQGTRMGLLAATYVGYPIWAFRVGRRLIGTGVSEPSVRQVRTPTQ
jgi:hypothetical protein